MKKGLITIEQGYEPFASQFSRDAKAEATERVSAYMAEEFETYKHASLWEFGQFMADLKQKNPRITGRSSRAIIEAIKERSADFDIPSEWFSNRGIFLEQPYEIKIQIETVSRILKIDCFGLNRNIYDLLSRFMV